MIFVEKLQRYTGKNEKIFRQFYAFLRDENFSPVAVGCIVWDTIQEKLHVLHITETGEESDCKKISEVRPPLTWEEIAREIGIETEEVYMVTCETETVGRQTGRVPWTGFSRGWTMEAMRAAIGGIAEKAVADEVSEEVIL